MRQRWRRSDGPSGGEVVVGEVVVCVGHGGPVVGEGGNRVCDMVSALLVSSVMVKFTVGYCSG